MSTTNRRRFLCRRRRGRGREGESGRADVNATFLQPFVSYTTTTFTSFALNTESTYDWQGHQWTVPVNIMVQQLMKIGKQPVAFQVGYRQYAEKPDGGPDWGLRFAVTFLFPKSCSRNKSESRFSSHLNKEAPYEK